MGRIFNLVMFHSRPDVEDTIEDVQYKWLIGILQLTLAEASMLKWCQIFLSVCVWSSSPAILALSVLLWLRHGELSLSLCSYCGQPRYPLPIPSLSSFILIFPVIPSGTSAKDSLLPLPSLTPLLSILHPSSIILLICMLTSSKNTVSMYAQEKTISKFVKPFLITNTF